MMDALQASIRMLAQDSVTLYVVVDPYGYPASIGAGWEGQKAAFMDRARAEEIAAVVGEQEGTTFELAEVTGPAPLLRSLGLVWESEYGWGGDRPREEG
jgi:hypothetical protein